MANRRNSFHTLVLLFLLPGCAYYRTNHRHSDDNQQTAQSISSKYELATSQIAGTIPSRLTNLNAQFQLTQTVEDSRSKLDETVFANALRDRTWDELRKQIFQQWGIKIDWRFSTNDFADLSAFAARLKKADPSDAVSIYILSKLSPETKQALQSADPTSNTNLPSYLVKDLNHIIQNGEVYETQRFSGINLSPTTQILLAKKPVDSDLIFLNRKLLEDGYANDLRHRTLEDVQATLDNNLTNRIWKVQAIGKILLALTDGQKALVAEAAQKVGNATNALVNATNKASKITATPISLNLSDLLSYFQTALITSGEQYRSNAILNSSATDLENQILKEVTASRDPASTYALAAVVGTGLDETSFTNLDLFLSYLSEGLIVMEFKLSTRNVTNFENLALDLKRPLSIAKTQAPKKSLPQSRSPEATEKDPTAKLSVYLVQHLALSTREMLTNYQKGLDGNLQSALIHDLNNIIEGGSIYETNAALFEGIKLSEETQQLTKDNPHTGIKVVELNRRLLSDAYTNALDGADAKVESPPSSASPADVAWSQFEKSLTAAKRFVWGTQLIAHRERLHTAEEASRRGAAPGPSILSAEKIRGNEHAMNVIDALARHFGISNSMNAEAAAKPGAAAQLKKPSVEDQVFSLMKEEFQNPVNSLTNIVTTLPQKTQQIATNVDSLDANLKGFKNLLLDTNIVNAFTKSQDPLQASMFLLTNAAGLSGFNKILTQQNVISTNDLKQIGVILRDIASEQNAAAQRLLSFFADLSTIQLNLYQENLRHYDALQFVARKELKRWDTLKRLSRRYSAIFVDPAQQVAPDRLLSVLSTNLFFFTSQDANAWKQYYHSRYDPELKLINRLPFEPDFHTSSYSPPTITPDSQILTSIRLLAENARSWQKASPSQYDPVGFFVRVSGARSWEAIRLIQGYYLMLALNEQYATANSLFLRKEIQEHDIFLDGILYRAQEADIRLRLGDQLAFHSSGITDADIQAVVGIIQTGLLAWIGAKQ